MKAALIQLPHFYGAGYSRPPASYPLGLGYLSSALRNSGIAHEGVNLWEKGLTPEDAVRELDLSGFDYFCISAYSTQYKYFKPFAALLKRKYPQTPIICGGPGPTFSSAVILENNPVDVCVIGEGEATLVDLLKNYSTLPGVKGISYLKDGKPVFTEPRPGMKDLDTLALPDREIFDTRKVMLNANPGGVRKTADILAGRGCPYQCTFCSKTFSGLRMRSVAAIIAEVRGLIETYGVNHLQFNDELVIVGKPRTLQLCAELKKLNVQWTCQGRINLVDEEVLRAMKDSGCIEIGYGVESVSQAILDGMKKQVRAEAIIPVIELTRRIGIAPIMQYMYGFPGENDETIERTFEFFKRLDLPFIGASTTPLPGSALYNDCLAKGLIKDEEAYLLRLDSGYNLLGGNVNLTDFTDEEARAKQRRLQIRITHQYYKRRPLLYAKFILATAGRKLKGAAKRFRKN